VGLLQRHLELARTGEGIYERDTDRTWWGHEALFGGYAQSLGLAAITAEVHRADAAGGAEKAPRSVTTHFLRPFADGPFRAEVTVERVGRAMANATARLFTRDKLCGLVVASLGISRPLAEFDELTMPVFDPVGADDAPVPPGMGIPTHEHYDFFPRVGGHAFAEKGEAHTGGWLVPREPAPVDAYLMMVACDVWKPAAYRRFPDRTHAVSADITLHFRADLDALAYPLGSPVLVELTAAASREGYADEDVTIWGPDGRLLAQTHQLRFVHG
jgi:acyl-CoA thioesterase